MERPWVQIAIDTTDVDKGCQLAELAIQAGADWIEAGTPLLYFESVNAIGRLVEVSKDVPVIVDFKAQDGVYRYFTEAARQGAKVATVLAQMNDGSIKEAVRAGKEHNIKVCADLFSVQAEDLVKRAKEVEALGVDYLLKHVGFDELRHFPERRANDGLKDIVEAVSIPVGTATFTVEDAIEAVSLGASFVVQGEPLLSSEGALEKLTDFIKQVKGLK